MDQKSDLATGQVPQSLVEVIGRGEDRESKQSEFSSRGAQAPSLNLRPGTSFVGTEEGELIDVRPLQQAAPKQEYLEAQLSSEDVNQLHLRVALIALPFVVLALLMLQSEKTEAIGMWILGLAGVVAAALKMLRVMTRWR